MSDEEMLSVDSLSDKQWLEIRKLAIQLLESKRLGSDQFKCSVHAFVLWLASQDQELYIEVQDTSTMH